MYYLISRFRDSHEFVINIRMAQSFNIYREFESGNENFISLDFSKNSHIACSLNNTTENMNQMKPKLCGW